MSNTLLSYVIFFGFCELINIYRKGRKGIFRSVSAGLGRSPALEDHFTTNHESKAKRAIPIFSRNFFRLRNYGKREVVGSNPDGGIRNFFFLGGPPGPSQNVPRQNPHCGFCLVTKENHFRIIMKFHYQILP